MSECNESRIGIARVFSTPKVAYAPVAMTDDYALRASRNTIGTQPSLFNQLNRPMMSSMYSSRTQPLEELQLKPSRMYSPTQLATGYNCQSCGYQ